MDALHKMIQERLPEPPKPAVSPFHKARTCMGGGTAFLGTAALMVPSATNGASPPLPPLRAPKLRTFFGAVQHSQRAEAFRSQ